VRAVLPAAVTVPVVVVAPLVVLPGLGRVVDTETATGVVVALLVNWSIYLVPTLLALWLAIRLDRGCLTRFGLDVDRAWLRTFGAGVAISLVAVGTSLGYGSARGFYTVSPGRIPALVTPGLVAVVVGGVVAFFLVQVVYEELVFRAVMLQNVAEGVAARGRSPVLVVGVATAVSLALFGAFHLPRGPFLAVYSAFVGVPFALAYLVTGRLALPIGIHFGRFPVELLLGFEFGPVAVPAVAETTGSIAGLLETSVVQLGGTCLLVLAWASLLEGEVTIVDRVTTPDSGGKMDTTDPVGSRSPDV